MTSGDRKQKTSITSQTKLYKETLENINIFPLINLVVALTVVFFFTAIDLLLLQFISSKSIILFILLFLFVSSNQVS